MTAAGSSRTLANGRSDTRLKPHRHSKIIGQFIAHSREMRLSPAWRALKSNDKLVLERLEEEHMAHAGRENGKLKVTFNDFAEWGIRRHAIAEALARVEALGFVQCVDRGRAAWAEYRNPARYRLTYAQGNTAPTNEWTAIRDEADARRRIDLALKNLAARTSDLSKRLKQVSAQRVADRAQSQETKAA